MYMYPKRGMYYNCVKWTKNLPFAKSFVGQGLRFKSLIRVYIYKYIYIYIYI